MSKTQLPELAATRPIQLPDLATLPPHLAAKLRNMNPEQLKTILKGEQ